VLLLFYDHDPAGMKISRRFRKNLEEKEREIKILKAKIRELEQLLAARECGAS